MGGHGSRTGTVAAAFRRHCSDIACTRSPLRARTSVCRLNPVAASSILRGVFRIFSRSWVSVFEPLFP